MDRDVFEKNIRAFANRAPFEPYLIELTSGAQLRIDHPEALVSRGRAGLHISPAGDFTLFGHDGVARIADIPAVASAAKGR